ncbi:UDP-3-O-(3-hydroxymyristoyl)glucosamine N-acyltransferase [Candidatus Pelagibacter sp. HIMB1517]|uniref:UDP-3-O-(3-hydroxymyristoyl)glucosamine N-acyltransferase n=1 Tax=Candidatus Pelagibacter sp. HIMB1517 TaxID=3413341 RepID=UPI003F860B9D
MKTFFENKGPFDINYLLKKTFYSKKKKFKKFKVTNIATLEEAKKGEITFFENKKYTNYLLKTKASYCLVKENFIIDGKFDNLSFIESKHPLLDFICIAKCFYPDSNHDNFNFILNSKYKNYKIKYNSLIDKTVKIGKNFKIGLNTVLKKNVVIGNNVKIGSNCVISNSIIEDNVVINDGTIIGKIGYGFKMINKKLNFIPHIGYVEILDNVYIGSGCTIDRGSFSNTVIGCGTMLDNQVHIAHNVKIGSNCLIAGQVGIAGSSIIGNNCMVGGQSGISGHLKIGNSVSVGGNSGVLKNVASNKKVMGYPAVEIKKFIKRNMI